MESNDDGAFKTPGFSSRIEPTEHMSKAVVVDSLIPGVVETAIVSCLKRHSDLNTH